MTDSHDATLVVFRLQDDHFAVDTDRVSYMTVTSAATPVPRAPSHVRGLVNPRGEAMPLIDLRRWLGMASAQDDLQDFIDMLRQRENDHKAWLAELEASVHEGRAFTLTTDPHRCAFGAWYDTFATDNVILRSILRRFDRPHRRIHQVAAEVAEALASGDTQRAHDIIDRTRSGELDQMIRLFAEVADHYLTEAREIMIVLETEDRRVAVAVDALTAVSTVGRTDLLPNPVHTLAGDPQALVASIGRIGPDQTLVQVLDADRLCGETAQSLAIARG